VRGNFHGLFKKIARRRIAFTGDFMPLVPAFNKLTIGSNAIRAFPPQAEALYSSQSAAHPPDCSDDGPRGCVTMGEDIVFLRVVAVGPELAPSGCINQLRCYAYVIIGALYAALDEVTNIEILSHLSAVDGLVLVGDGGIARHDYQLGKLG